MNATSNKRRLVLILALGLFVSLSLFPGPIDAEESDVAAFVTRFYQQCLGREPDAAGLSYWADSLNTGAGSGADLAWAFIFSDEFQSRNTSDSEYVFTLYRAFFNREPDSGGYTNWMALLAEGADRALVLDGFTCAQEFTGLCENYGISATSFGDDEITVEGFVTRFYRQCLGREPDAGGLSNWVDRLNTGAGTGADLARAFIFSAEFQSRDISDEEYVTILYRAFFNREPDSGGYNNWLGLLAGGADRAWVLGGFTCAQEFEALCETYGIAPNSSAFSAFFPITLDGANTLNWTYRINQGAALSADFEGVSLTLQFSTLNLSVNREDMVRRGSFSGSVSGSAGGSFGVEFTENILPSDTLAIFNGQTLNMDMSLSAYGETVDIEQFTETSVNTAVEWFLSRSDFDQLATGYGQTVSAGGNISGYLKLSADGYHETTPFSEHVSSMETWKVVEKLNSYTVNKVSYNDVVVVNRQTVMPMATYSGDPEPVTITYWVARGIGMIKGIGQFNILGQPLEIELIGTNLSQ